MATVVYSKAAEIASECESYLQSACRDMAHDSTGCRYDQGIAKKVRKAKKDGVQDVVGWLADDFYNDARLLEDLLGDRLYDECGNNKELRNAVLDIMEQGAQPAMKKAIKRLRKD